MAHWLDVYYRRGKIGGPTDQGVNVPGLQPIAYTPMANAPLAITTSSTAAATPVSSAARKEVAAQQTANKAAANEPYKLTGTSATVYNTLLAAGFTLPSIDYVFLMCYMESGAWQNSFMKKDHNPGNIIFVHQQGATKGGYMAANKTYAAHYATLTDFAHDLMRVLSKPPGFPLQATSLSDYVHRLKLNGYFGKESEASYLAKMKGAAQRLRIIVKLKDDTDQKIVMPKHNFFKDHPVLAGAAIVVGVLVVGKVVSR
jgi:hypothetical protein